MVAGFMTAVVLFAAAVPAGAAPAEFSKVPADVAAVAERSGSVRVIVKVDQPAGTTLERAQDAVLAELAHSSCRVLHRYVSSPFLALEVGVDGLRVLDRSTHVVSVAGDFEMRPLSPGATR